MADGVTFQPIETIPADRRDGRVIRIKTSYAGGREHRARFYERSGEWCEIVTGGQLLGVMEWADPR